MIKIKINEQWWSAWKTFDWGKGVWGVGLNKVLVDKAAMSGESLYLEIGKPGKEVRYLVHAKTTKKFAEDYKLFSRAKSVNLYVLPKTFLDDYGEEDKMWSKKITPADF